jgi:hypothetical protein
MSSKTNEPIGYYFDHALKPSQDGAKSPIYVNETLPNTQRFIEMKNITTYRDGIEVFDIALFNFTALHENTDTRFKLEFWDLGVADVHKHKYRVKAFVNFERGP